jgi:predicted transcriptional regulator
MTKKIFTIIFMVLAIICQPLVALSSSQVITDKDVYNYGESIKVNFSNAPGADQDWICIVPAGSPDTEGGDYQYIPKGGNQGVLTFDTPSPGKYEVRAYYNYETKGYFVSARHAFSVVSSPDYEKAKSLRMERLERKIDPNKPQESNLRAGEGMVYIFRGSSHASNRVEAEIKANGKLIAVMPDSNYFLFPVPAGDVNFTTGSLTARNIQQNKNEEVWTMQSGEATIKVKANYIYYLKLSVSYRGGYAAFLEHVPHQEGADLIANDKLTILK